VVSEQDCKIYDSPIMWWFSLMMFFPNAINPNLILSQIIMNSNYYSRVYNLNALWVFLNYVWILLLPQTSCAIIVIVKFESCLIWNENIMDSYVVLKKLMKKNCCMNVNNVWMHEPSNLEWKLLREWTCENWKFSNFIICEPCN